MGVMLIKQVWLPNVNKIRGNSEKKCVSIGMTRLLCEIAPLQSDAECWGGLLVANLKILEEAEESIVHKDAEDELQEVRIRTNV